MPPPSDQDSKSNPNPFTPRSPWPRAPQQTFHLNIPKVPPTPPPAPPKPEVPKAAPPAPAKPAQVSQEDQAPPSFIAPGAVPPLGGEEKDNRMRLVVAGVVAVLVALAVLVWLKMREASQPIETEPAPAVEPAAPLITEPSLDDVAPAPKVEAAPPPPRRTTVAPAPAPAPTRPAPAPRPRAPASQPAISTPRPAPAPAPSQPTVASAPTPAPPPASAPGPSTPLLDPDAPIVTRDPSTGS